MKRIPEIETKRLLLRAFTMDDAPMVQKLAGAPEIAETTSNIPHPYEDGMAERWIATHGPSFEEGAAVNFAITVKDENTLIGAIGLTIDRRNNAGELGYWIGKPYWNRGYCSEAAAAVLRFAFLDLGLNRVQAKHVVRNEASGRVMRKIGMKYEGTTRQSLLMRGRYEDMKIYGIVRSEFLAGQ